MDDDELDGCDLVLIDEEVVHDDQIDGVVLFAGVDPQDQDAVAKKKAEWEKFTNAS